MAQSLNVEPMSLGTPSTTVPSDNTTASSTNFPLVSLEYEISPNPVSSTVMTSTAFSAVLGNASVTNSASSSNVSSPQTVQNNATSSLAGGGGSSALHLGSPSVSSATSPDSTSNHTNHLTIDQCTVLQSSNLVAAQPPPTANSSTASSAANSGAIGNVVVSNFKTDLEQLVASVAHEDSFKVKLTNETLRNPSISNKDKSFLLSICINFLRFLLHFLYSLSLQTKTVFATIFCFFKLCLYFHLYKN